MSDEPLRSVRMLRHGSDAPLPERRTLRGGPLTAVLERGDLRYVSIGGVEVVRRLYMAVRNRNWDTIEPVFTSFDVDDRGDAFSVRFTAEHVKGEVDFAWTGTIEGSADGTISYAMEGAPRRSFWRNRLGFCVLHPMELAGAPAVVETPDGLVERPFPLLISPHQPFVDMVSIAHAAGDGRITIRFEGDLFEMEDQRNWTDASYKTYCTPLRIPYPVEVQQGERIGQRVTVSFMGRPAVVASGGEAPNVAIGQEAVATLPAIGFGASPHRQPLTETEIARLRALRPNHLWIDLDLGSREWKERLRRAAAQAAALGVELELTVVAGEHGGGLDALAEAISGWPVPVRRLFVFPPVAYPVVFPRHDLTTSWDIWTHARDAFAAAGLDVPIGGGSRAYFTELNRAKGLPVEQLAAVTYTINPQVHAFDNLSLVETLAAQAETAKSAKAIAGGCPLAIGPITLRPPYNPNATGALPEPGPDELPDAVDQRQLSLFGAGWTLGSLHRLAEVGVEALTYYRTIGWRGLMERTEGLTRRSLFPSRPGQLFPLYHIFAAVADFAGGEVLPVRSRDPLATEALALRKGDRIRVLLASFENERRTVSVELGALAGARSTALDETTVAAAENDPEWLTGAHGAPVDVSDGRVALEVRPFGIVCLDGDASPSA